MPKGSSKSTAVIQRLLEERRQYEAWIAGLNNAADATPGHVRARVRADYEARLTAVIEELKAHGESAREAIDQKKQLRAELQKKEALAADKMTETELRHAVGEYDEAHWSQVHKDVLAELVSVREDLQAVEADIQKLEELDTLVGTQPVGAAPRGGLAATRPASPSAPSPPTPATPPSHPIPKPVARFPPTHADELAFIKSVTEDETTAPSARRASGAQFQPAVPADTPRTPPPTPVPVVPEPVPDGNDEADRTIRCRDCGTMNLPTEWYCAQCGAQLSAV